MVEDPRIMPKKIAKKLKYSGRGRSPSTLLYHLQTMFKKGISREPRLFLKPFESSYVTAYLCTRRATRGLYTTLRVIDTDPAVTYALCLSSCDFFLMSREDLNVKKYGLQLKERSKVFTPLFTIPKGWNDKIETAFSKFLTYPFRKGVISRELYKNLDWLDLDWGIYYTMGSNVRMKFTDVAKQLNTTSITVKKHFHEKVLPKCVQVNYFFPEGVPSYNQSFLRLFSNYEESIIEALTWLPCTTYVYPLEKGIILCLFHKSIKTILDVLEKMEEMAILDGYLLYNPVAYCSE